MILFPSDINEKLEFHKIIDQVKQECLSEMSKKYFDTIEISTDIERIQRLLDETDEYKKSMERGEYIPLSSVESVQEDVYLLRKEGYVLDLESIRRIYTLVAVSHEIIKYFHDPIKAKMCPLIHQWVSNMIIDRKLTDEIDRILDHEGEVKPNASDELMRISKLIKSKEREIDKIFNNELEKYKIKGHLADSLESIRNGRRVLTVAVEHKRKVMGIIHDESATGKTVFIEPEAVISINHELYNLFAERRHEIYKIIRSLCDYIRPYADALLVLEHTITKLDTIRAKAKLAYRLNACKPYLQSESTLHIKVGYNPILILKSENHQISIVPFDMTLRHENRIVVLSGPNAGGKSVVLKSVGLLQLMIQSGMLVTADENSVFGIFKNIFVDIGDQQSLDDDLSTYSSHLKNMHKLTEIADPKTLVLIDEFGSGTDPKIGGAIAEAILNDINTKKVWGVITTHYSNLKFFASNTKNVVNASMEFDTELLQPTYRFHIGKPGSSFAYEIAAKIGLSNSIVEYAQRKTGKNEKAIDDLLASLMSDKKEYESKMVSLLDKEDRLDKLIASYEHIKNDIDIKRKKLKLQAKEHEALKVLETTKEVEKLLKEVKKSRNEDHIRQVAEALKVKQSEANKELEEIKTEVFVQENIVSADRIEVGNFAKLRNGTASGKIISIDRGMAELQMGFINLKVPVIDLITSNEPIHVQNQKSITTNIDKSEKPDTKIDIREYTKQDALRMVQDFMDKALLNSVFEVKIIHGIGTGVMKNEVRKLLKQYRDIKKIWHPAPEMGGEGVTYVQF
jgi:DNA mismatch repair protein MutS2